MKGDFGGDGKSENGYVKQNYKDIVSPHTPADTKTEKAMDGLITSFRVASGLDVPASEGANVALEILGMFNDWIQDEGAGDINYRRMRLRHWLEDDLD